jgi:uncharacterized pyridoxamine 5'-phosphate oxidase family protein
MLVQLYNHVRAHKKYWVSALGSFLIDNRILETPPELTGPGKKFLLELIKRVNIKKLAYPEKDLNRLIEREISLLLRKQVARFTHLLYQIYPREKIPAMVFSNENQPVRKVTLIEIKCNKLSALQNCENTRSNGTGRNKTNITFQTEDKKISFVSYNDGITLPIGNSNIKKVCHNRKTNTIAIHLGVIQYSGNYFSKKRWLEVYPVWIEIYPVMCGYNFLTETVGILLKIESGKRTYFTAYIVNTLNAEPKVIVKRTTPEDFASMF